MAEDSKPKADADKDSKPVISPEYKKLLNKMGQAMMLTAGVLSVVYGLNAFVRHKGYNAFNQPQAYASVKPGSCPVRSSQPFAGPYTLLNDNTIKFVDDVVVQCEDAETGSAAMSQMDIAVSMAPRDCTWKEKAAFARKGLGYNVLKDKYVERAEVGLPKK
jgi:hypothetical protein